MEKIVGRVWDLFQETYFYRVYKVAQKFFLPKSPSSWNQTRTRLDQREWGMGRPRTQRQSYKTCRGQFNQHAYARLLGAQISKAQNDSKVISWKNGGQLVCAAVLQQICALCCAHKFDEIGVNFHQPFDAKCNCARALHCCNRYNSFSTNKIMPNFTCAHTWKLCPIVTPHDPLSTARRPV